MYLTGRPTFCLIAKIAPPLAVPSSLVRTIPVHCTDFENISAWAMAFCPVVASSTSSTSCGAPGICRVTTLWIFSSSRIRCACVCSRPAVSTMTTSNPRAAAFSQASWATLAGSLPWAFLTISQPIRWHQIVSCSTAAARNVSHAATSTFLPSALRRLASLAIDVVLPEPLTPAIMTTVGPLRGVGDARGRVGQHARGAVA